MHKKDKKAKKEKERDRSDSSKAMSTRKGGGTESHASKQDKKKKKKKDKKHKEKEKEKDKGKKGKKDKKKKKRKRFDSDSSSNSSDDSSELSSNWSIDDKHVDYGSPEKLSDGSDQWEGRSVELYDSDSPPDYPLNSYHAQSKPRILVLEDFNDEGDIVQLQLDYMEM